MQEVRIGYIPFENNENAYTARTVEILSRLGKVTKVPTLRELLRNPSSSKPGSYDFIIANWIENCIINQKGGLSAIGILKLILNITLMKALSRKTIFVRHNNYPHSSSTTTGPRAARIIDIVETFFDHVITHSGHNETSKRKYIPHPLYRHPDCIKKTQNQPGNYFLIFGRILPYKKIETLIEAIPPNIKIVIAGSAPDKNYVEKLRSLATTKEIQIIPEFISDEKAALLSRGSRGIVITHNDNDMIVSGTFFYSLSIGTPLYTISTPFTEWAYSTLKVPGLHVSKDIPSLCTALALSAKPFQYLDATEQSEIEQLFGDIVIEKKWSEIFQPTLANI